MVKNIVIIGGGISGLSLLYFLRKKYSGRHDVRIVLLEKNAHAGGNIRTLNDHGALFECGPNGFLANQPVMIELVEELGLSGELISANAHAKKRFVLVNDALHPFPTDPLALFQFKPFSFFDKLRIFAEPFIPKGKDPQESIHQFVRRRFGSACAKYFADPMVSGIYGGHSEHLNVKAAFPKVYEFEQNSGSVIRGMMANKSGGKLKAGLKSFKNGMGVLMTSLSDACKDSIHLGETVRDVIAADPYYLVVTDQEKYPADALYICTPAFAAGSLLEKFNTDLSRALMSIEYAPVAVIGLLFKRTALNRIPEGFGYLIPSSENKKVLGVLVESNNFENRSSPEHILFRVMIGGVRNPDITAMSAEALTSMAADEIAKRYGVNEPPENQFMVVYPKAIPQYETQYPLLKNRIVSSLTSLKGLFLLSNYLDGVSANDCVKNAQSMSMQSDF